MTPPKERDVAALVIDEEMREVFKGGRPLDGTLRDYWAAPGIGSLLYPTWNDRPHRIVYDLIAFIIYQHDEAATALSTLAAERDEAREMADNNVEVSMRESALARSVAARRPPEEPAG